MLSGALHSCGGSQTVNEINSWLSHCARPQVLLTQLSRICSPPSSLLPLPLLQSRPQAGSHLRAFACRSGLPDICVSCPCLHSDPHLQKPFLRHPLQNHNNILFLPLTHRPTMPQRHRNWRGSRGMGAISVAYLVLEVGRVTRQAFAAAWVTASLHCSSP